MKRALPVFLSVALIVLTVTPTALALGSPAHRRPPGIAASAWIPISNDLAAVIEQRAPDPTLVPGIHYAHGQPLALGYFLVWRNGRWLRLDSLLQQPMSRRPPSVASTRMLIDRTLGFVIERQMPAQPLRAQPEPSALGYFVIKRSGHWLGLQPMAAGALYRGPLTSRSQCNWVPITKSLRFVIEQQMPQRYVAGQLPSVLGYFMGRLGGRWLRLGSIA